MKTCISLCFIFLVSFPMNGQQYVGIKMGVNVSRITSSIYNKLTINNQEIQLKEKFSPGFNLAALFQYKLSPNFSLFNEIGFENQTFQFEPTSQASPYSSFTIYKNYLYMDILIGYHFGTTNNLQITPLIGYSPSFIISELMETVPISISRKVPQTSNWYHSIKGGILFDYETSVGVFSFQINLKQRLDKDIQTTNNTTAKDAAFILSSELIYKISIGS